MNSHTAHLSLLFTLVVSVVTFSSADAAPPTPPPRTERFSTVPVTRTEQLAKYMSPVALEATRALILKRSCPQDGITLFRNRKPNRTILIVAVQCYPPLGLDQTSDRHHTYLEYPLTIAIQGNAVTEVDLSSHGFMYESGHISFITDLDGNDIPEFWLSGAVCECDGEPDDYGPNGCDCDGGYIIEFKNRSLNP